MRHARAALRGLLLLVWTGVCWLGVECRRLWRRCRRPGAAASHGNPAFRAWARGTLRILGVELRVEGRAPPGPWLLVSNHLGYLDVVVLGALTGAHFVAKAEVAAWPLLGFLTRRCETLYLERGRARAASQTLAVIEDHLRRGAGVVLFPEGTSTDGSHVLRFHPALFEAALRTDAPVVCAALSYRVPPGSPPVEEVVCWWGGMTFPDHAWRLLGLPCVTARVTLAPGPANGDRRELARRARDVILAARRFESAAAPRGAAPG